MPQNAGYKVVRLANGSRSIHSLAEGETFHPVIGPVAEAEALYVHQIRLRDRLRRHAGDFVIWDVGLGAAANALTVLQATRDLKCSLQILSFDMTSDPLRFALEHRDALGYLAGWEPVLTRLLADGQTAGSDGPRQFRWVLHPGDFPALLAEPAAREFARPDAILFDPFSPAKNPAMWTQPLFDRLFRLLDPARPCVLPSFSRSTMFRVTLLLAGFHVGVGQATGAKEETTVAANAPELIERPLGARWLERACRSSSAEPLAEPVYRQAPLSPQSRTRLLRHPQFAV